MKKMILLSMILPALSFGQAAFTNDLFLGIDGLSVSPSWLSIESVEFCAESVQTNLVSEWITTNVVYQGGALENYATATNEVKQQVLADVVTTNAAKWICNVYLKTPKRHIFMIAGKPVPVELKAWPAVQIEPSAVTAVFGSAAAGLEYFASKGAYEPKDEVHDAFLMLAAAALTGNQ